MSAIELVVGILILGLIALVVAGMFSSRSSRSKREELRRRFGPEYDRAVERFGNVEHAERELLARAKRVQKFKLHRLNDADQQRFTHAWQQVQVRFVDDPSGAVADANELIKHVMRGRGYPVEDFEQRVADLSVDHADVVQHYRAARVLALANSEGRANTEELRQAFVHYRALFAELLDDNHVKSVHLKEARV